MCHPCIQVKLDTREITFELRPRPARAVAPAANCYASFCQSPLWIPNDLPQMLIRVLEVACIASPKCILGRLHDDCTCALGLRHDRINFGLGRNLMPHGKFGGTWRS